MLVDGIPIGNYNLESYRKQLGVFYHEQDIFNGTLFDNVTMGDDTISHAHLMNLSSIIGLSNFIESLPKGFNEILQSTGKGMSSIIAKKILLLRAFAGNPKLLLLDEPFEIAGGEHCGKIADYLIGLKDVTVVVVSSDMDFASKCNQVVSMEKGFIADVKLN
jgi:ABC-type multidrug transport system fused ATPase/permease subunit